MKRATFSGTSAILTPTDIHVEPITPVAPKKELNDAQREIHVKQALTRFVRNRGVPEELENLRHRLIVARVLNGLTALEACKLFGWANSTQLSLIEAGKRPPPQDHAFIKQAARAYDVSTDWLLGLSPTMEPDSKVAHQYALLRGTTSLMHDVLQGFAHVAQAVAVEMQIAPDEIERGLAAVEGVTQTLAALRNRGEFDDMLGGASVLAAVERLGEFAAPLRRVDASYRSLNDYLAQVRAGTLPEIPRLVERYNQRALAREILGEFDEDAK